jgi:Leucine rich repeat
MTVEVERHPGQYPKFEGHVRESADSGVSAAKEESMGTSAHEQYCFYLPVLRGQQGCHVHKRTCWIAVVIFVMVLAGSILAVTIVAPGANHDSAHNGGTVADLTSPKTDRTHSDDYYKERWTVFRAALVGVASMSSSTSAALLQPDTPQSRALDWMVYQDSTVSHSWGNSESSATAKQQFLERYAVLVLFYACGGEEWSITTKSGDNVDQESHVETCQWDFVACDDIKFIVELKLSNRRLIGQIPNEVQLLSSLQTLDLSANFLRGTLSNDLWQGLSTSLSTHRTCLHHALSSRLRLTNKTHFPHTRTAVLQLSNNELVGSIPSTLAQLAALTTLDLGVNSLTGALPTELARLTRLETLYVNNNYLTGPVLPDATSVAWPQLVRLNIDETQLDGTLASSIVEQWSDTLQELYIGRSAVEFTIPASLNLPQLTTLNIASPASGGPFPNVVDMLQLRTLLVPCVRVFARHWCACPNLNLSLDHLINMYTYTMQKSSP